MAVLAASLFQSCERSNSDDIEPEKLWSVADVQDAGYQIVPISTIKQMYYDAHGNTITQSVEIEPKYAIKGKVVSSDRAGNVYKSIYLQDETGAIEIKIGTYSTYLQYAPGQTVYVLCQGLVLGNYRYNLSLGRASVDKTYANANLEERFYIDRHVKAGEKTQLTSADTTVLTSPDQIHDGLLGKLIRIEGAVSRWGTWSSDNYPSFLETVYSMSSATVYTNYGFLTVIEEWKTYISDLAVWQVSGSPEGSEPVAPASPRPATLLYPTYAFNANNNKYYGSARFEFGSPSDTDPAHNLILRTSGYSDFALNPLPEDGKVVNITAILNKYSSSSGGFVRYQLMLNDVEDVQVLN